MSADVQSLEQMTDQGPTRVLIHLRESTGDNAARGLEAGGLSSRPNARSSHQHLPLRPAEATA
jgi:hypothetical protein